jgi:hypothetical protein
MSISKFDSVGGPTLALGPMKDGLVSGADCVLEDYYEEKDSGEQGRTVPSSFQIRPSGLQI